MEAPRRHGEGFAVFGKVVVALITLGLAAAIVESLTGLVLVPGMAPIEEGFVTVGAIAIVLAGAFPLVYVITRVFQKPLLRLGRLLGMNDVAAAGMVATLANNIPHVPDDGRHGSPGQDHQRGLRRVRLLRVRRPPGFTAGFDSTMLFP